MGLRPNIAHCRRSTRHSVTPSARLGFWTSRRYRPRRLPVSEAQRRGVHRALVKMPQIMMMHRGIGLCVLASTHLHHHPQEAVPMVPTELYPPRIFMRRFRCQGSSSAEAMPQVSLSQVADALLLRLEVSHTQ